MVRRPEVTPLPMTASDCEVYERIAGDMLRELDYPLHDAGSVSERAGRRAA